VSDIFGPIIDAGLLETWVRDTLEDWFPTYLQEIEVQRGMTRGKLPSPRAYIVSETADREAADQLPAIVVISPGLAGHKPVGEGDGSVRAIWTIGVGAFVSADTRENTKKLVRIYCAATRAILLQHRGLGGVAPDYNAANVEWLDESFDDDFQFVDRQTISLGITSFEVEVAAVVNRQVGPVTPPDPDVLPGSQWPTADEVFVDIEKEAIA
jgi:hypothetical protein